MSMRSVRRSVWIWLWWGFASGAVPMSLAQTPATDAAVSAGAGSTVGTVTSQSATAVRITGLFSTERALNGSLTNGQTARDTLGVNGELRVQLAPAPAAASSAQQYALFFNGHEVKGLPDAVFDAQRRLVFELPRNDKNGDLWTMLLGAPTQWTAPVVVALGERSDSNAAATASIFGAAGTDTFSLQVLSPWRLVFALLIIVAVVLLLWVRARRDPTLRDGMLPQLQPSRQTYSLARWQMAFWFTLVFAAFVLLFVLLSDFNTISTQALVLMGISGATALAAVSIDKAKDSPADAVSRALQALGLNSYDDVERVRGEIEQRQQALAALPPPTAIRVAQLQGEIQDRENILRMYEDKVRPFVTQGWFRDLTTDLNGTAIHRLQVFCWTWVLGGVFVIEVWRQLAMPEFSTTLLALMGISSAGYVGFKIPEANS